MSHDERLFLSGGEAKNENGSSINLGSFLPSEKKLDVKLWHDPEHATDDLHYLLRNNKGEVTPLLSRLALKGISYPLFVREFQGEETGDETNYEIENMALRSAVLLHSYLELIDEPDVDQPALNQAINDATISHLVSRTFSSSDPDLDDIILLPTTQSEQYASHPTTFSVLRRKSLGRASLVVADIVHNQRPIPELPETIYIRPAELTGPKANMLRLAKVLVAEQQLEPVESTHESLIEHATAHLYSKIYSHFDALETKK
ncbi:hypothetical protein H7100_00925 [Candidatus Saccharibacteria bacterium]|nr:hypothetical protein [Candidatus Saccharibacteria bacterium]